MIAQIGIPERASERLRVLCALGFHINDNLS